MVWLRGRIVIPVYTNVVICVTASMQPGGNNDSRNALHTIWGKTRNDLERGGLALGTIRKQSKIKLSESFESLHQIADNLPPSLMSSLSSPLKSAVQCSSQMLLQARGGSTAVPKKRRQNNSGFYYGLTDNVFFPQKEDGETLEYNNDGNGYELGYNNDNNGNGDRHITRKSAPVPEGPPPSPPIRSNSKQIEGEISPSKALTDVMGETLYELREMREDIYALREEMQYMKEEFKRQKELTSGYQDDDVDKEEKDEIQVNHYEYPMQEESKSPQQSLSERVDRQNEFENLGKEVEKWAHRLLFEEDGEKDGWKEVKCNKMVRNKFNAKGKTSCYVKWMKDSRGKHAKVDGDENEYPCIKVFSTVDAPIEDVSEYLSEVSHMEQYNDLVMAHRDLEEISPHSKICWSQCPQILFIKPRDFVTYCHHRWRRDGTQIVVSQACEHESAPGNSDESDDKACRAYSLRGANFISRDPTDPTKTRMAILAHADPGGGVPQWAMKTAINSIAPIEPYKLFYRIDKRVTDFIENRPPQQARADFVHATRGGRSTRPAGLSQLGYACFWANGGGKVGLAEPVSSSTEKKTTTTRSSEGFDNADSVEKSPLPSFLEKSPLLPFLDL